MLNNVAADNRHLPDNVAENAQLTDTIGKQGLGAGPDHVVLGHRGLDLVHENVGAALLGVFDLLQEGSDVLAVHVVAATLPLRLQHIFLRVGHSQLKRFVSSLVLNISVFKGFAL